MLQTGSGKKSAGSGKRGAVFADSLESCGGAYANTPGENLLMNLSFQNKVALVTGASSGMGLATARAFAEAGGAVVLADVREDLVKAEAQKLLDAGHKAIAIRCDVSDDAQVAAMVGRTVAEFGR